MVKESFPLDDLVDVLRNELLVLAADTLIAFVIVSQEQVQRQVASGVRRVV